MIAGDRWREEIDTQLRESAEVKLRAADQCGDDIMRAAQVIVYRLGEGGKLLICGNGGSAADAQHIAAELIGRLDKGLRRKALPAIALTTDTSVLTALGNDFGFDAVFQRQLQALVRPGDVLLLLTTSGLSPNLLRAVPEARARGAYTVALTGDGECALAPLVDLRVAVPSADTQRIQETHIAIGHVICTLVEGMMAATEKEARWATGQTSA